MIGAQVEKTATGKYSTGIHPVGSQPAHIADPPVPNINRLFERDKS